MVQYKPTLGFLHSSQQKPESELEVRNNFFKIRMNGVVFPVSKLWYIWSPSLQPSLAVIQNEWIWTSFTLHFFSIYFLSLKELKWKQNLSCYLDSFLISFQKKKKRQSWRCSSANIWFSFFWFFACLFQYQQLSCCLSLSLMFSGGFNLYCLFCPIIIRSLCESKTQKTLLYIYSVNCMYLCMSMFCCRDKPAFKPPNQNFIWGHFS